MHGSSEPEKKAAACAIHLQMWTCAAARLSASISRPTTSSCMCAPYLKFGKNLAKCSSRQSAGRYRLMPWPCLSPGPIHAAKSHPVSEPIYDSRPTSGQWQPGRVQPKVLADSTPISGAMPIPCPYCETLHRVVCLSLPISKCAVCKVCCMILFCRAAAVVCCGVCCFRTAAHLTLLYVTLCSVLWPEISHLAQCIVLRSAPLW